MTSRATSGNNRTICCATKKNHVPVDLIMPLDGWSAPRRCFHCHARASHEKQSAVNTIAIRLEPQYRNVRY
jgi:hypothetical protein